MIINVSSTTPVGKVVFYLTWGKRDKYPDHVMAHHKLWVKWFLGDRKLIEKE